LIAPRFFLALAHDDVAQHFIFLGQLGGFFRSRADQFDLLKLLACFVQLRAQLGDGGLVILILLLARRELRLKIDNLFLHIGEFFFLLRFVGTNLANYFFGVCQFLFQIGIFGNENFDALLGFLEAFQLRERVVAFFGCVRNFLISFGRTRICFITFFAGGGALLIGVGDFGIGVVAFYLSASCALLSFEPAAAVFFNEACARFN